MAMLLSSEPAAAAAPAALEASKKAIVPFEAPADPDPHSPIDAMVFARLRLMGIQPANRSSDAVFVRRAYLDVIGTLPTATEAAQFLQDPGRDKRRVLIETLLARDEFADYWAMKWSDLLRVKAEFPINLWPNATQAYYHWIRDCLRADTPYDRMVHELLTANGSNFRAPQVNFYRAMQNREPRGIAQSVALTFMGARAEKWPEPRLRDMAVFFSQIGCKPTGEWKEEIVFFDSHKPPAANAAVFPDGTRVRLQAGRDPREAFAAWLTVPGNPWFARNVVNRIWSWLLGRGIVHEPDDLRPDNPPRLPDVLDYLEQELLASRYDLKQIYRLILNSETYQLSSIPQTVSSEGEACFAYYPVRRLDAETLIDALCQITGTTEQYTSAVPEPFTVMPEGTRAISLPDGSISSAFLELFGRPARDTGLEAERNNAPTAAQRLHLLNSTHIQRKIEQSGKLQELAQNAQGPRDVVERLYLTILSRYPTDDELKAIKAYSNAGGIGRREAMVDLAWALVNTSEFLYRH
jgi:hypothetical protein